METHLWFVSTKSIAFVYLTQIESNIPKIFIMNPINLSRVRGLRNLFYHRIVLNIDLTSNRDWGFQSNGAWCRGIDGLSSKKNWTGQTSGTVDRSVVVVCTTADSNATHLIQAIGERNRVESEMTDRLRQKQQLQAIINEKKMELERIHKQYDSLSRVESEQMALIERLSNNEP